MSTSPGSHGYSRFDELAEEFAKRYRRGERPSVEEYVERLPEMADEIREMFPALIEVEQAHGAARAEIVPPSPPFARHLRQIGDYRILSEVGRGGMGIVYEAEQISLGRRVALKVLASHLVGDHKTQERFRREAKAAARLHHTNIVPVFEVGRDRDVSFYAMQLIQGQGLEQVIAELRRLRAPGQEADALGLSRPEGLEPSRPDGLEPSATVAQARVSTTSIRRKRDLGQVAELLLTGRLAGEATELPTGPELPEGRELPPTGTPTAAGQIGAGLFDPEAASGLAPSVGSEDRRPVSPAPDLSGSAMLPGGTHISEIDSSGRRQPFFRSVAQIGRQAAQGLAHAHARGIVHRDIKPSNLLLDTSGIVWITDFGLAKAEDDSLTATGDLLGTLRYMAPERFRGEGDARADIYALGLTLYELLTLRPAYSSSDRLKLIEQVKAEEPARPRSLDRRIPRDLETIVLKAIEKEAGSRYQSADAMAEDLRRFLADEPIKARQVSTSERYWRWARRNPVIAILGGVVTTLLIAVTIGSIAAASWYGMVARSEKLANDRSQLDRKDAIEARRQAIRERDNSRRLSSSLTLEKGIALAHEGHVDRGLLWMLEALKTAPDDADEFRRMVRWNLGAWLGQVHKPLRIIDRGGPCTYLAFSPDGRSFATGFSPEDRAIWTPIDLWDAASGRKLSSLPGTFAPFAFRPDGKVLFAYADAWRMLALDLVTGRVLWTTPRLPGDWGERIAVSPDGSTAFASRRDKPGSAWMLQLDLATGRQRGEPIRGRWPMAVASGGEAVATVHIESGEACIDVYEMRSGQQTSSWPAGNPDVYDLIFSPDQKSLFGVVTEGDVFNKNSYFGRIWDTGTGKPSSELMARTTAGNYARSADRLLTQTDDLLVLRDTATGRVRGSEFAGVFEQQYVFARHPDGRTVLALAADNTVRSFQLSADAEPVADGAADKQAPALGNERNRRRSRGLQAFWSSLRADGLIALSLVKGVADRELIRNTDPAACRPIGRPLFHHTGWIIGSVAFSPDGRFVATGSNPDGRVAGEVRLWDISTGRLRLPPMPHTNYVRALAFHPDGKVLAAGDYSGQVRFWDTSTGREIGRPFAQGEIVLSLAYSPDGKILAAGLADDHTGKPGTRLWDTGTGRPIGDLLPSTEIVNRIDFRPDGCALLAGSASLTLGHTIGYTRLWDTVRAKAMGDVIHDEIAGGFRPDGRAFLTLGRDGTVKLRDATTGAALATLLTSSSAATCAAFRGDGGLIATGFEDGTVRLCDPATKEPVGPPRSMRHAVRHVAFLPDGRFVAAIDEFGESRTWPVPAPLDDSSFDDLTLRIEARTGLRMEPGLTISRLGAAAWREQLEELRRLDSTAVQPDTDPAWHEPLILEAEQNGNAFAAIWHLDRLLAERPHDWFLYARRGRAWSLSDRFDKAAADYQEAERLGKRDLVLDFQTYCVIDCTKAERWAAALWYLDRLIAERPDERLLHEDRAAVYGKLGREADRQAELVRVFALGADEGLVIPRALALGRAGRWAEAAGLLARCGRKGPLSRELAQAWSIACLKAGDRAGYREACAAFLAQEGPDPTVVWNALSAAALVCLAPDAIDDYQLPISWLEKRLSATPAPSALYRYLFSNALAGLLLRARRTDEAILRLNEGTATATEADVPIAWLYLALAHARRRSCAEAHRCLSRLRALPPDSSATFWELEELDLLKSEAESSVFDAEFPSDPFQGLRPR
jgi:serine/threonine protein kinase/WD40 repeat protein/tetratricopeptide (TPR) repeat protein